MVVSSASSKVSGGRIPGSRWASMVLPEVGDTCPSVPGIRSAVEISETLEVHEPRAETRAGWADRMKGVVHFCACGCGTALKIRPEHRSPSVGIPRFVRGHQPNHLGILYSEVRSEGLLLIGEVCRR